MTATIAVYVECTFVTVQCLQLSGMGSLYEPHVPICRSPVNIVISSLSTW